MKGRQWYHKEGDKETGSRRREAIVDRALLYAHLLSIIDERSKEDDEGEAAVAETDHGVSQEAGEEQQSSQDHAIEAPQTLASEINALYR